MAKAPTRPGTRWALALALAILTAAIVELLAFAALSIVHGRWWHYAQLAALEPVGVATTTGGAPAEAQGPNPIAIDGYVLHPYLGYVRDVGPSSLDGTPDEPLEHFGFYADSGRFVREARDDQLVVGIFGGSVARNFGYGPGVERLAERLRALPQYAGRSIVFSVPALGGYKQPQPLLAFAYLLSLGAHFDLVIEIDGFNEVALPVYENMPKDVAPFYPRSWYFLAEDLPRDLQIARGAIAAAERDIEAWSETYRGSVLRFSYLAGVVREIHDRWLLRCIQAAKEELIAAAARPASYAVTGPRRAYGSDAELYADLARIWSRGSLEMHRLAAAHAIPYFHFLQPNQYVPDSKPLTPREREAAYLEGHAYQRSVVAGYPRLLEEGAQLRARGVRFFDLTRIFAGHTESLYVDPCCHFGNDGDVILGDAIGSAIAAPLAPR
jgi:hypothetical protein